MLSDSNELTYGYHQKWWCPFYFRQQILASAGLLFLLI